MTTLAEAFAAGVRWRERQNNNGIVSDQYLAVHNPYSQPTPTAEPPMCGAVSAFTGDPCVEDAGHNGRHMSIRGLSWEPIRDVTPPA